jgi:hypothetical protein
LALALALVGRLVLVQHGRRIWIAYFLGVVGVVAAVYLGAVVVAWRRRKTSSVDAVYASFGRFRLSELLAANRLTPALRDVDPSPIRTWARGWVEGTVVLTPGAFVFEPGRIARRARVRSFAFAWPELSRIELVPQVASLNIGLQLTLQNGSSVGCEVRGRRQVEAALQSICRRANE